MYDDILSLTLEKGERVHNKYLYLAFKRLFDIIVSAFLLIILAPLFLIIAILIKMEDGREVFKIMNRIGKGGKEFKFYKFQTMVKEAEAMLPELLKDPVLNEEYQKNKKFENDPRITKLGKFLRKTSLDELPQLINVFKGEMSLIGNRPYLPREKEDMGLYYNDIIKSKPGITGYWQTSGRNDLTFNERLKLEKFYSNNFNAKMDIKIFFKTFSVVFQKKGAK
ncbi:MAG: hypothetical protein HFI49_01660 [Bacilli bacterium]|jgi:lipopolysaccharide/colanic/teichoic acid biosynthesis glycosyltransferase|nr:hypothetical protein [Bacilli bacterium]